MSVVGIHRSNLLKLGMEIYSYNDHCSPPFSRACWLGKHHQLYSGLGADIVMESITLTTLGNCSPGTRSAPAGRSLPAPPGCLISTPAGVTSTVIVAL